MLLVAALLRAFGNLDVWPVPLIIPNEVLPAVDYKSVAQPKGFKARVRSKQCSQAESSPQRNANRYFVRFARTIRLSCDIPDIEIEKMSLWQYYPPDSTSQWIEKVWGSWGAFKM